MRVGVMRRKGVQLTIKPKQGRCQENMKEQGWTKKIKIINFSYGCRERRVHVCFCIYSLVAKHGAGQTQACCVERLRKTW